MNHCDSAPARVQASRRDVLRLGFGLAAAAGLPGAALAQGGAPWPSKPIRIICGQATGSSNDATARAVGEFITARLGAPVVIENKPGAVGTIAGDTVVRAAPDGYTLLCVLHSQLAQAPVLLSKVPFDPDNDLIPIGAFGTGSSPAVVRSGLPVNSMRELIEYAKKTPVSVGNYGIGSGWQIMVTQLVKDTGAQFNIVNYRGTGPMVLDLMAGNIDVGAGSLAGLAPGLQNGKFRAIHLISGSSRNPALPNLQTWEEAGFTGEAYTATQESNMFLAPKGTPHEVIERLAAVIDASYRESPRIKTLMEQLGQVRPPWTGEDLRQFVRTTWPAYRRLTKALNLQVG